MTSATKKLDSNTVELTVELNHQDLARYIKETEQEFTRGLEMPGFRKGKVPQDLARKQIDGKKLLEAALQTAMQRSLGRVISEQDLDIIEASDLSVKENSAEKLLYTVKLSIFPEVQLPALGSIKVPHREVSVDTKELDETLDSIRSSRAVYTEKTGPAQKQDRVEVDFEVRQDGALIEGGESKNHPLIIGQNQFVPGFEDQLVGMNKEEKKEFSLQIPNDFSNKKIAGKKLDFVVTMKEIKDTKLPELNDDFAKTLGNFQNVDQLIMNIKDGLLEEKKEKEQQRVRLEIIDKIIAGAKCQVPEKMIGDQLGLMIQNFDADLHKHDMELSIYLAKLGKTQEDLKKDWRPEAERQVKMALILHNVARNHKIEVAQEEVDEATAALIQSTMIQEGSENVNFDAEKLKMNIRNKLANEKTLEYLEKTCSA